MTDQAGGAASAVGTFPQTEDRKPPVVRTDVARGLLTEDQARDAARGLGHPDTRIDTPASNDPYVGNLAAAAEKSKQEGAEKDVAPGDLDPTRSGEAAARTLDKDVRANQENVAERRARARDEAGTGELVTAADRLAEQDKGKKTKPAEKPAGDNK